MAIDCRAKAIRISPLIYGIALPAKDQATASQLHAAASRWGGNLTSTYNFEIDAWNAGNDWFYENREAPLGRKVPPGERGARRPQRADRPDDGVGLEGPDLVFLPHLCRGPAAEERSLSP